MKLVSCPFASSVRINNGLLHTYAQVDGDGYIETKMMCMTFTAELADVDPDEELRKAFDDDGFGKAPTAQPSPQASPTEDVAMKDIDEDDDDPESMAAAFGAGEPAGNGGSSSSSSTVATAELKLQTYSTLSLEAKMAKMITLKMVLPMAKVKKPPPEGEAVSDAEKGSDDEDDMLGGYLAGGVDGAAEAG